MWLTGTLCIIIQSSVEIHFAGEAPYLLCNVCSERFLFSLQLKCWHCFPLSVLEEKKKTSSHLPFKLHTKHCMTSPSSPPRLLLLYQPGTCPWKCSCNQELNTSLQLPHFSNLCLHLWAKISLCCIASLHVHDSAAHDCNLQSYCSACSSMSAPAGSGHKDLPFFLRNGKSRLATYDRWHIYMCIFISRVQ